MTKSLKKSVPSVFVSYARNGSSTKANALDMRPMQERAYEKREQYLLIKSPPALGKSRALMQIQHSIANSMGSDSIDYPAVASRQPSARLVEVK